MAHRSKIHKVCFFSADDPKRLNNGQKLKNNIKMSNGDKSDNYSPCQSEKNIQSTYYVDLI